jgi:hypothetical protein
MPPEVRSSLQVSACKNSDVLVGESIRDVVGKSGNEYPTCDRAEDWPGFGVLTYAVDSRENRVIELEPETRALTFVPPDGRGQLFRRQPWQHVSVGSPAEDLCLNAPLDVVPGLEFERSAVDRLDATGDLLLPGG